jgi:hypothetical protein
MGTGCYATYTVTVAPAVLPVSGTATVCVGGLTTLTDGTAGGAWSTSPGFYGTIDAATGKFTGTSAGVETVAYTTGTGCSAFYSVTVNANPAAITGPSSLCVGGTVTLADATSGGVWTSTLTSVATIGSGSGVVTALSAGVTTISYTLGTGYNVFYG